MDKRQWDTNGMRSYRYEAQESSRWWQMESPLSFALVTGLILSVVVGGWYVLSNDQELDLNTLPVIQPEPGPVKIMPETVGKVDIPHRDKLFYNQVNAKGSKPVVEQLLPPPEEPIHLEDSQHELGSQAAALPPAEIVEIPTVVVEPPKPEVVPEVVSKPAVITKKAPVSVNKLIPPPAAVLPSFQYRVQIAALPSPERAKKEWSRLAQLAPGLLKFQPVHYARVDLGAKKGIYYRVQVGRFSDKLEAQTLCKKLQGKNMTCMVVTYKK